jgi:hypothetical protein
VDVNKKKDILIFIKTEVENLDMGRFARNVLTQETPKELKMVIIGK